MSATLTDQAVSTATLPRPSAFAAIMPVTARPDLVFERGSGSYLFDQAGKRYLDWVQGWAVNCLGHSPAVLVDALARQAATLINPSPAFFNRPALELADGPRRTIQRWA